MLRTEDFCRDWLFSKDNTPDSRRQDFTDDHWQPVLLPHTWNADDMRPGSPMQDAHVGPCWYRKRFTCPTSNADQRVFLLFEAVANFSEVWVDGCFVGGRDGGFLSFCLDITNALAATDEHVVAVQADNSPRIGSVPPDPIDWERFGGIYRPVWIGRAGGAHFNYKSIHVRTVSVSAKSASVMVRASVRECVRRDRMVRMVHRLLDPVGVEVGRVECDVATVLGGSTLVEVDLPPVANPQLWSPESPAVYSVESSLLEDGRELDREVNPLGFRWFAFDADTGFSLNDRPMKLRGVNAHQEFIGLGNACGCRVARRDIELMKQAGINFLRTSHYPRDDRTLDLCDRLGIMVMEEQPFWHGSIRAWHGAKLLENARRLMREMVEHHANHPCIVAWNTVNEIMLTPVPSEPHPDPARRTDRHKLHEDEWPFAVSVIEAMNDELHRADPDRPTSVVVGGSWDLNERAGVTKLADIVCYNGGALNEPEPNGEFAYDIGRRQDPKRISMMSEGVLNHQTCARDDWEGQLRTWQCYADHWERFYQRDWFCGGSMWVFSDYSAKGTYRTRGLVDGARLPYESFYFFKAMWNPEPMVHICAHWDWPGQEDRERPVVIFSNCDRVELLLNDRSLGAQRPDTTRRPGLPHPPIEWTVPYEPGELRVVGRRGDVEVVDRRVTSGPPVRLALSAENVTLSADGCDVAFFTAMIADARGNRCYNVAAKLTVRLDGAARLAGPSIVPLVGGLARAAVRSDGRPGPVKISVNTPGLSPESLALAATED
jgi:beta-galactosidase